MLFGSSYIVLKNMIIGFFDVSMQLFSQIVMQLITSTKMLYSNRKECKTDAFSLVVSDCWIPIPFRWRKSMEECLRSAFISFNKLHFPVQRVWISPLCPGVVGAPASVAMCPLHAVLLSFVSRWPFDFQLFWLLFGCITNV